MNTQKLAALVTLFALCAHSVVASATTKTIRKITLKDLMQAQSVTLDLTADDEPPLIAYKNIPELAAGKLCDSAGGKIPVSIPPAEVTIEKGQSYWLGSAVSIDLVKNERDAFSGVALTKVVCGEKND